MKLWNYRNVIPKYTHQKMYLIDDYETEFAYINHYNAIHTLLLWNVRRRVWMWSRLSSTLSLVWQVSTVNQHEAAMEYYVVKTEQTDKDFIDAGGIPQNQNSVSH